MALIDGVILKGRHIVIPEPLQRQVLEQLHVNHMGSKKTKLLANESLYWIGMSTDIKNHIKNSLHLDFQQTLAKEKIIHHEIPGKHWEVV